MGKIIVAGEMHQDLYYKTSFLSDLSDSIAKKLVAFLSIQTQPDLPRLQEFVNDIIADTPKKIVGESSIVRGGNGNNSAELLARMKLPVQLLTVIGTGGDWMLPQLQQIGINPATVFQKDAPTPISTIIEDPRFTKMLIAPNLKLAMNFEGIPLPQDLFRGTTLFFATPMDSKYVDLLKRALKEKVFSTFTLELQKITELSVLDRCVANPADLMFANINDCAQIARIPQTVDFDLAFATKIDNIFHKYAMTRVYTWGKNGALISSDKGQWIKIPPYKVTVVNRTGAGDTFAAGFITKLYDFLQTKQDPRQLSGQQLEHLWKKCAEFGNAAAAYKISYNHAPNRNEMEEFLKNAVADIQ